MIHLKKLRIATLESSLSQRQHLSNSYVQNPISRKSKILPLKNLFNSMLVQVKSESLLKPAHPLLQYLMSTTKAAGILRGYCLQMTLTIASAQS
jgi:hypothetical protein